MRMCVDKKVCNANLWIKTLTLFQAKFLLHPPWIFRDFCFEDFFAERFWKFGFVRFLFYKKFEKSPELFSRHFIILKCIAKDFCGFVVEEKFCVFKADAFECVNRKSLVENVFKTEENYITFGKAFVIISGVQGFLLNR